MAGVVLVTGGARGIGRATALLAAEAGFAVAVHYRERADEAGAVGAEIERAGGRAAAVRGDVAEGADVERLFAEAEAALGPLTALVNSAGIGVHSRAADFEADALTRLMAVNVVGTMLCCREAVRRMSTALGGRGGAIVNVSSMAATIGGRPGASAYAASKAAVDAFTVGLAREVAAEGIRVNAVRPGVTLTDMTDALRRDPDLRARVEASIPMRRAAEAREIAEAIVWLLSDRASFVSGARIDVSGGGFVIGQATR
ncbi:MAG TPA: SDR family oxidoreductase [Geminicoccaceae bacterium]|nr:SDR family oxidoreductase [Geminicoccaceae bacterium]